MTMKSILDPTFVYIPAAATDLRKTFARVRREMKKAAAPVMGRITSPRAEVRTA
jgi:hypothetical protein